MASLLPFCNYLLDDSIQEITFWSKHYEIFYNLSSVAKFYINLPKLMLSLKFWHYFTLCHLGSLGKGQEINFLPNKDEVTLTLDHNVCPMPFPAPWNPSWRGMETSSSLYLVMKWNSTYYFHPLTNSLYFTYITFVSIISTSTHSLNTTQANEVAMKQ